ncbi:MAG: HAD-IA family hydrolase [Clostridia bacterium]|nr:HAD-IA family hydrolase [Clostridia bacterium]
MTEVSAGIIRRQDGKVLICRRGEGRNNAHLWEFPGGKLEKGESPCACLRRELMEELCLPLENLREVCQGQAQGILFHFIEGTTTEEPRLTEHEAFAFVTDREMLTYAFCPADTGVARAMALNAPALRHFFWDFDGTLMDTYPAMTEAFVRMAKRFGLEISPEDALGMMKVNLRDAATKLAQAHGFDVEEMIAVFREEERTLLPSMARPVAGIPEALAALPGKHYLVTHRDRASLDYLETMGLKDYFTDYVVADDGFPRKPAPDSLLHLMHKHGLNPDECVMIGDRPLDTAAGRNAGMLSCLLDEENRFPDDPCDMRTHSAYKLAALLCPAALNE